MRLRGFWHIFIEGIHAGLGANVAGFSWERQIGRTAIGCLHQNAGVKDSGVMRVGYANLLSRGWARTRSGQACTCEGQLACLKWSVFIRGL